MKQAFSDWVIDAMDMYYGIEKGNAITANAPKGMVSAVSAVLFALAAIIFFWITWVFDWQSTAAAVHGWVGRLYTMGPVWITAYISLQVFINLIVFTPTIIEFVGPILARAQISISKEAVLSFIFVDLITDAPTVLSWFSTYAQSTFDWAGFAEPLMYYLFAFAGLIFVSMFSQLFFFTCTAAAYGFVTASLKGAANARRH